MTKLTRRDFGLLSGGVALTAVSGESLAQTAPPAPAATPPARGPARAASPQRVHPELQGRPGPRMPTGGFLDKPTVVEKMAPGPKGAPDVQVFIINSAPGGAPKPVVIHMHGGGMTGGDAKYGVPNLQKRCLEIDCTAVTINYRLAPATRFPGSVEDNYAVLKWVYANATELNIDRTRIAVIGESAGGGHAAMLAILARDRGEIPILFQALMYPMLDNRGGFGGGWEALLGVPADSPNVPYGVPARIPDVKGLPPTFMGMGSIDPTALESLEYARRLIEAGIFVGFCIVPGAPHAFNSDDSTSLSRELNSAYYGSIARAFKWRA